MSLFHCTFCKTDLENNNNLVYHYFYSHQAELYEKFKNISTNPNEILQQENNLLKRENQHLKQQVAELEKELEFIIG